MKYEIIGWTYCGDQKYPMHKDITASVDAVIIKEIRKYGYLFGGDAHEEYCPVLNDGTYVSYSWRGWGRIIALAYEVDGDYAYMNGYMDMLIKPEARKYPDDSSLPADHRIVPKDMLAETHVMHLSDDMFEAVKAGTKTVEIRLFDDKRKLVDIGDYIEFCRAGNERERVKRRVADLDIRRSFEELFTYESYENGKRVKHMRYTPEQLGASKGSKPKSLVEGMYKYYDRAQEKKYGVMAFTLEKPRHTCQTFFRVWFSSDECYAEYNRRLSQPDLSDEEFNRLIDESFDVDLIEEALLEISDGFVRYADYFKCGENDSYDADVNVMLRKTLEGLLGQEDKLRAIGQRCCCYMTLEIYAGVCESAEEPAQSLSLDTDIKEFLQKADVHLKVEKFEI